MISVFIEHVSLITVVEDASLVSVVVDWDASLITVLKRQTALTKDFLDERQA